MVLIYSDIFGNIANGFLIIFTILLIPDEPFPYLVINFCSGKNLTKSSDGIPTLNVPRYQNMHTLFLFF